MARSVYVHISGLRELGERMRALGDEVIMKASKRATRKAAVEVRDAARRIIDQKGLIKTGAMREAVSIRRMKKASSPGKEFWAAGVFKIPGGKYANTKANRRAGRVGKIFMVDPPEFYWKFIEFGTVKMGPRPFLVPAYDQTKGQLPEVMAKSLDRSIKTAVRRMGKATQAKAK